MIPALEGGQGLHCLVVDDSRVVRKAARRLLEGFGFAVREAEDGAKALAVPGIKTQMGVVKGFNLVELLGDDKGKGEDVEAAKAKIQEVTDGKEKAKMPKCTPPKLAE